MQDVDAAAAPTRARRPLVSVRSPTHARSPLDAVRHKRAQGGGGAVRHGRTAGGQAPGRVRAALCCVRRAGVAVKATTAALPAAAAFREPQTLSTACTLASNFGPAEEPCRRTRWTTSWAGVCICLSILLPCVRSCVSDQRCCYLVGHGMLCRKG